MGVNDSIKEVETKIHEERPDLCGKSEESGNLFARTARELERFEPSFEGARRAYGVVEEADTIWVVKRLQYQTADDRGGTGWKVAAYVSSVGRTKSPWAAVEVQPIDLGEHSYDLKEMAHVFSRRRTVVNIHTPHDLAHEGFPVDILVGYNIFEL